MTASKKHRLVVAVESLESSSKKLQRVDVKAAAASSKKKYKKSTMPLGAKVRRPSARRHCVRWEPSSFLKVGGGTAPPILAQVLWPNGCMDQGATWYWGRPRPRPHCVT